MMLFDKKRALTQILGPDGPQGKEEVKSELHSIAEELKSSIEAGDIDGMVESLKAFFYACDELPHVEGEHLEE